jgi:hypothetical protein
MGSNDTRGWIVKKATTPNSDWQRIWFSARHRDWSSLALVPSDGSVDVNRVADMLSMTGRLHAERPVSVVNATGVHLEAVQQIVDSIANITNHGERVIVPVDPVADNPAAIAVLRACSAAVLVVSLGQSLLAAAETTLEIVDREKFMGGIVLEQDGRRKKSRATLEPARVEV